MIYADVLRHPMRMSCNQTPRPPQQHRQSSDQPERPQAVDVVSCVRDGGPGRAMVTAVQSGLIRGDDGIRLHVGGTGAGAGGGVLSGGPCCVQYLEDDEIAPVGFRAWYPEPRGVGRSAGSAHTMAKAVADLEAVRRSVGVESWI